MRIKLKKLLGQRICLRGTVLSSGTNKKNHKQLCISLKNIKDEYFGDHLCDHLWLRISKHLLKNEKELCRGDIVCFHAKVCEYIKSNNCLDYGVKNPTKFKIINYDRSMTRKTYFVTNKESKNDKYLQITT